MQQQATSTLPLIKMSMEDGKPHTLPDENVSLTGTACILAMDKHSACASHTPWPFSLQVSIRLEESQPFTHRHRDDLLICWWSWMYHQLMVE